MVKDLIAARASDFEAAIDHFAEEAARLRTGRANPGLVENIAVDYYGTKTALKQMASITVPEARQLLIQPWDRGSLQFIETALKESDLGLNPNNDGAVIRLMLPQLTEDRRRDLVKTLNARAEDGRISIRSIREDIWKQIQEDERAGEISEDDKFSGKEELQKAVDEYNQRLENLRKKKEDEILTV